MTNRFVKYGVDPVKDLENTEFQPAFTSDLIREYKMALDSDNTPIEVKELITKILATGFLEGFFGVLRIGRGSRTMEPGFPNDHSVFDRVRPQMRG